MQFQFDVHDATQVSISGGLPTVVLQLFLSVHVFVCWLLMQADQAVQFHKGMQDEAMS